MTLVASHTDAKNYDKGNTQTWERELSRRLLEQINVHTRIHGTKREQKVNDNDTNGKARNPRSWEQAEKLTNIKCKQQM